MKQIYLSSIPKLYASPKRGTHSCACGGQRPACWLSAALVYPMRKSAKFGVLGCVSDCLRATPDQDEISNCKSWTVLNRPDEEITLSAESAAQKCH